MACRSDSIRAEFRFPSSPARGGGLNYRQVGWARFEVDVSTGSMQLIRFSVEKAQAALDADATAWPPYLSARRPGRSTPTNGYHEID